jgi:hypothetical protein
MTIKWVRGVDMARLKKQVEENIDTILHGKFISIDPASRTGGYAVYNAGSLIESGTIQLDTKKDIGDRLAEIGAILIDDDDYDLMAIERIRGGRSHDYLKFSIGAYVASIQAPVVIEVPVNAWKKVTPPDYVKSDENDAIMIGKTLIVLAKELL